MRVEYIVAAIAAVGGFSFVAKVRMLDGYSATSRGDVRQMEADLVLWKTTARDYLERDEGGLQRTLRSDISPLHKAAIRRMLNNNVPPSRDSKEDFQAAKIAQKADQEFLKEEEQAEAAEHIPIHDWPPPGDWHTNTEHALDTQIYSDLPTWSWTKRYSDMKSYYTTEMTPTKGLLKQLNKVMKKTTKNWDRKDIWASYPGEDISDCAKGTPECLFWRRPEVNISIPDTEVQNSDKNYRKCCIEHRKMRDVTRNTAKVLYNAGIDMWIGDGTLLGARRGHGTVIPWDTDIDVFSKKEDKQKIIAALKAAKADGTLPHAWEKDAHGRDMFWVYYSKKKMSGDSHLEIWLTDGKKQKRNNFTLVMPLQPCPFYDFTVLCPNKINDILTIAYGNWQQPDKEKKV